MSILLLTLAVTTMFTILRFTVFKDSTNKEFAQYVLMVLAASAIVAAVQLLGGYCNG
jgi:hypothetical protein